MRGRRAFAILTIYLLLLAGFALMAERLVESNYTSGFGNSSAFAGAAIGQGIFAALLMLMTLQVVFLAPSSTSGSISLEREKQTLELLIATPISSLAIVVGKLLSALVYVFLLIAASMPLMAVVFVYGGVGPEDVLRGYIVLITAALWLGSFGLLCSSIVKRTTAATAITIFGVLAMTVGTIFVLGFWQAMGRFDDQGNREGLFGVRSPGDPRLPEPVHRPGRRHVRHGDDLRRRVVQRRERPRPDEQPGRLLAAAAGPDAGDRSFIDGKGVVGNDVVFVDGASASAPVAIDLTQVQPFDVPRDELWPKSVFTWLVLSVVFLLLSVQAVSPTRRWRIRARRPNDADGRPE